MYESHFNLKGYPFRATTEPDLIYESAGLRDALNHFTYAIDSGESFVLLTGEVGCGKTTAVQAFQQRLDGDVLMATISHATLDVDEMLHDVAVRFGISVDPGITKPRLVAHLKNLWRRRKESGSSSLLVLDEAQLLKPALLEELRLLSNLEHGGARLIHVFLVGQPEIEDRLRQPELRPLRQRISLRYKLKPLDFEETRRYLIHRLVAAGAVSPSDLFTSAAVLALHHLSQGLPREINVIAGHAMLNAYVDGAQHVEAEHVQLAKSESGFEGVAESSPRPVPTPSATAAPELEPEQTAADRPLPESTGAELRPEGSLQTVPQAAAELEPEPEPEPEQELVEETVVASDAPTAERPTVYVGVVVMVGLVAVIFKLSLATSLSRETLWQSFPSVASPSSSNGARQAPPVPDAWSVANSVRDRPAPPAPRSPPPPAEIPVLASEPGYLTVVVEPWARVAIDGNAVGETPLAPLELSAGTHSIVLENDHIVGVIRDEVVIESGARMTKRYSFGDTGYLSLAATPWADVDVDGRSIGQTPLARVAVPEGSHSIRFVHPELGETEREVIVVSGQTTLVKVQLQ